MKTYIHVDTLEILSEIDFLENMLTTDDMGDDWREIPYHAGIVWHDDQSQNVIRLAYGTGASLMPCNYRFVSSSDIPLLREYADQIADLLR